MEVILVVKLNRYFIFTLVLFIAFIGGLFIMFNINESPDIKTLEVSEPSDIKTFELSEYQYYMENFSSEETLGVISDEKDLLKKVEVIWIEKYGEHKKTKNHINCFMMKKMMFG